MSESTYYDRMHDLAETEAADAGVTGPPAVDLSKILAGLDAICATARILAVSTVEENISSNPGRLPLTTNTRAALLGGIELMSEVLYSKSITLAADLQRSR
ncbi:hypothetical protein [Cupriavidus sp. CuC1]|uniref:hypothetical protein n=1 Tax=Cupriavidus sp. CuC1 TaxID=3373131 RepID=UPI0037CF846F